MAAAGYFLRWNAGVSCRTSYQIWGSWNLPNFLLRDGSLTLMNIASLMILAVLCVILPTGTILHTNVMSWSVTLVIYWGGCPEMFRKSVPKSLSWLSYVLLLMVWLGIPKPIDYPTYLGRLILVLRGYQEVCDGVASLKMNLNSHFVTNLL